MPKQRSCRSKPIFIESVDVEAFEGPIDLCKKPLVPGQKVPMFKLQKKRRRTCQRPVVDKSAQRRGPPRELITLEEYGKYVADLKRAESKAKIEGSEANSKSLGECSTTVNPVEGSEVQISRNALEGASAADKVSETEITAASSSRLDNEDLESTTDLLSEKMSDLQVKEDIEKK